MARRARKLKDEAAQALRKGQVGKALALYLRLERGEPREGAWSQRVAEMYRRMGQPADEVDALARAADRFARAGFLLKAIAACKMILAVDPAHTSTQELLVSLYARHGLPPEAAAREAAAAAGAPPTPSDVEAGVPAALEAPAESGRIPSPQTPLDEILLTDVVAAARPAAFAVERGASEIPLGSTDPGRSGGAAAGPREEAARAARDLLPLVPIFSSLQAPQLRRLIDGVRLAVLPEGEVLFRQGDAGDALYVVAEGAVVPVAEGETRKKLAVLEPGDFFGEIALVTNEPRTATIEALIDSTLLAIDRALVASMVRESPAVLQTLLRFVRDRLVGRLAKTSPLFAPFDTEEARRLARRFRFVEAREGTILVRQSEPSRALFVLLAGRVEVVLSEPAGDTTLAALRVGDVFGEMSILTGDPAIASVVAARKSWVLALPDTEVDDLLGREPRALSAMLEIAESRRRENEESLRRGRFVDGRLRLV